MEGGSEVNVALIDTDGSFVPMKGVDAVGAFVLT